MKAKATLDFRIEAMPGSSIAPTTIAKRRRLTFSNRDFSKEHAFQDAFYSEFNLKVKYRWASIDMDSPDIPRLVERLKKLKRDGIARIPGASLTLTAQEDEESFEWFLLRPDTEVDIWSYDPYPTIKADKVSGLGHIGSQGAFSEGFVSFCRDTKLRGMEFIWLKDAGRHDARQWFRGVPLQPIGRGLDHPWFDPKKLRGEGSWQPKDPVWRKGVNSFNGNQLRKRATFGIPHRDALFSLLPKTKNLTIRTPLLVLKKYLPSTDFAYTWMSGLNSIVCCNLRSKNAMLKCKIARPEQFIPIPVFDKPPNGCADLDAINPKLPACPLRRTAGETGWDIDLALWREWANHAYQEHLAASKPQRKATMKSLLAMLKRIRRQYPEQFGKPVKEEQIKRVEKELGCVIPEAWRQVLQITNGFQPPNEVAGCDQVLPVQALPSTQQLQLQAAKESISDFPEHYLFVTRSMTGDSCVLDLSKANADGECPVICISHETLQADRTWPTIAAFIKEIAIFS